MTANELRHYFNENYGIHKEWPKTFEVDAETYENCYTEVLKWEDANGIEIDTKNRLMFKNVELILKVTE